MELTTQPLSIAMTLNPDLCASMAQGKTSWPGSDDEHVNLGVGA